MSEMKRRRFIMSSLGLKICALLGISHRQVAADVIPKCNTNVIHPQSQSGPVEKLLPPGDTSDSELFDWLDNDENISIYSYAPLKPKMYSVRWMIADDQGVVLSAHKDLRQAVRNAMQPAATRPPPWGAD